MPEPITMTLLALFAKKKLAAAAVHGMGHAAAGAHAAGATAAPGYYAPTTPYYYDPTGSSYGYGANYYGSGSSSYYPSNSGPAYYGSGSSQSNPFYDQAVDWVSDRAEHAVDRSSDRSLRQRGEGYVGLLRANGRLDRWRAEEALKDVYGAEGRELRFLVRYLREWCEEDRLL